LGELDLVFVHQLSTALVHHAGQIGHINVMARNAKLDQQTQARQCRRACTGGDQLDLRRVLADDFQRVEDGRAHRDGRAMLVVMKNGNLHALAQLALDIKAVRRLDVFEVDGAKSWLQRGDDVDQLDRVAFVNFDVKHIDAGKLLEQDCLALHHRLGRQGSDVAKTQHGRTVRDDSHKIAARRVLESRIRIAHDFFARRSYAWRVGQSQIALIGQLLGGCNLQFARRRKLMVFKRGAAKLDTLFVLSVECCGGWDGHVCVSPAERPVERDGYRKFVVSCRVALVIVGRPHGSAGYPNLPNGGALVLTFRCGTTLEKWLGSGCGKSFRWVQTAPVNTQ